MKEYLSMNEQFTDIISRIIEDNIDNENFSVEDLAKGAGLSRSMLHRKLKKLTGKSASDLITEKRLLRAKELLENDVATASEIAYRVGFNSPSYFNKVFKKHFKISPGEVRKHSKITKNQKASDLELGRLDYFQRKTKLLRSKEMIAFLAIIVTGVVIYLGLILFRSTERSIAVLPLNNLTGQAENDYFVNGMHDALIGELGKLSALRVISRKSTLRYRDSDMLLPDIAKELGVNTIVEGSVLGVGDSLRILIQLIDVFPKERHILANEYTEGLQNVLAMQFSAVKDIANKIDIKISKPEQERLEQARTVNPETYKAYLRGMYYINLGTPENFEKGIKYLLESIDKDPADPFAYAALALGYANVGHGQLDAAEAFRRAISAANTAIKLDPTIDEAYTAQALIYLYQYWEWDKAKEAFESAIKQNPNNALAHAHFAWYHILFYDLEKAIYHGKKAADLNPLYVSYNAWLSLIYYKNKEYNEAESWAKKALELRENVPYANYALGLVNLHRKNYTEAIVFHEKLPVNDHFKTLLGYAYVKAGKKEKALVLWNEMEEKSKNQWVNPCYRGMMAVYLGFTDKAFELLNEACDKKFYPINYIHYFPFIKEIWSDPRYAELLKKMNLPHPNVTMSSK